MMRLICRNREDALRSVRYAEEVSFFMPLSQTKEKRIRSLIRLRKRGTHMSILELFITAVGLSMDAFAVAVTKGLSMRKMNWKHAVIIGLYFGVFQALMPLIGYLLGVNFTDYITAFDHWIAFLLLGVIGANMIKESFDRKEEDADASIAFRVMILLALATSIDALAVGISFAFLRVNILAAIAFIGIITFLLSTVGVKIGNVFGARYKSKAEFAGGLILILMGLKILLEHLGILTL